jgi:hypothetical protein
MLWRVRNREVLMSDVAQLSIVPGRSDALLAADHRKVIEEALKPVMAAIDAAKVDGFTISFSLGADYAGKSIIGSLQIAKHF